MKELLTAYRSGIMWSKTGTDLLLKPCWEVAIRQKDVVLYSGEVRDEYVYVVVDALTGKEK